PMRVYSRVIVDPEEPEEPWITMSVCLPTLTATWYDETIDRPWFAGNQMFGINDTDYLFYYEDRFQMEVSDPTLALQLPTAWWRERPLFPVYTHAWIETDCEGANAWGFHPGGQGKLDGVLGGKGQVSDNQMYIDLKEGITVGWVDDPTCLKALCACIRDSKASPPNYCLIGSNCGSWVADMMQCASSRAGKNCLNKPPVAPPPYKRYPTLPPGGVGIQPGGCYDPDGTGRRIICN
ncbi:MAG: hypothetical protein KIT45_13795, partial [Fimbriimonadia bacterium]|nr:hypothetical protein [Fimbriimonadia bacterium]